MLVSRFAHLEEKERRKPVWVGDSYLVYVDAKRDR
jgi:predicted RNA-binding protein with TRAM domain